MVYCIRFRDVEEYLARCGYRRVGSIEFHILFRSSDRVVTMRRPNVDGNVPEALANDALAEADLPLPDWEVFWCD